MADTRTTSLLESFLSIKDSKAELTSRLDLQEVSRLSQTCKNMHTLFKQPLAAAKLLDLSIQAKWDSLEKMVETNPLLMFQPANGIDINGTKIKCSPLQYLLYVHDYYGQEIFEACAKTNNLLKEFIAHAHTQHTGFDLKPFCLAYFASINSLKDWQHKPIDTNSEQNALWCEGLGSAQLRQLPRHMLKQMCAEQQINYFFKWDLKSKFNYLLRPQDDGCIAYNLDGHKVNVYLFASHGIKFALTRGPASFMNKSAILRLNAACSHTVVSYDFEVFKALFAARKEQQLTRISRLEQELQVLESTKPSPQPTKHV